MGASKRMSASQGAGNRLMVERALVARDAVDRRVCGARGRAGPVRTVSVNLAESPLGWLKAHGHVDARQYEAGERLRGEWERAQLGPRVTMRWDAAPVERSARGAPGVPDRGNGALAAKLRFEAAVDAVGPGLSDVLWRVVCVGDGMREAETALGWPARAGKLVLCLALDRLAAHYRIA